MHEKGIRGRLIQSQFYDGCALLRIHGKLICVLVAESKRPQAYGKCGVRFGLIMPKMISKVGFKEWRPNSVCVLFLASDERRKVHCFVMLPL